MARVPLVEACALIGLALEDVQPPICHTSKKKNRSVPGSVYSEMAKGFIMSKFKIFDCLPDKVRDLRPIYRK